VVSDSDVKRRIRVAAEEEERDNYHRRMSEEWKAALRPLGTDWVKTHLTTAPYFIAVFAQAYGLVPDSAGGERQVKHYYAAESTGIAVGFLLASLRQAGLVALTHTPSRWASRARRWAGRTTSGPSCSSRSATPSPTARSPTSGARASGRSWSTRNATQPDQTATDLMMGWKIDKQPCPGYLVDERAHP